jgi:hypothetical protein
MTVRKEYTQIGKKYDILLNKEDKRHEIAVHKLMTARDIALTKAVRKNLKKKGIIK